MAHRCRQRHRLRAGRGRRWAPTVARLAAAGVSIGPHTPTPDWYGESLNVMAALDALWEAPVAAVPGGGL